jgi:hypothetical protein
MVEDFSELLRVTFSGGTMDVTGWTDVALRSLCDLAREKGVRVVLSYYTPEENCWRKDESVEKEESVQLSTVTSI